MRFRRICSPSLDPRKVYYALTNEICGGPTKKFANSLFAAQFPEEIKRLRFDTVSEENGRQSSSKHFDGGRTKDEIYVSTAFGIVGGLLRSKDLKHCSFIDDNFYKIINCINSVDLADYSRRENKTSQAEEIEILEEKLLVSRQDTENLKKQLEASSTALKKLENQVNNKSPPNSVVFPPTPDSANQSTLSQSGLSPNVEEISKKNTSRPTIKRRSIESRTKALKKEIDDVCNSHRESLATVLGHQILAGDNGTQNDMEELLDIVIDKKGSKEGFESIFSNDKWISYFKTLRRPDWALLYFKIKAKLPDDAWQTMLNITNLGRTGVSNQ